MVLKVGFLIVFLLLFQSLEAKKKKPQQGITNKISLYVETVGDFFKDAWDGLWDLLPTPTKKPHKKKKSTEQQQNITEFNTENAVKKDKTPKKKKIKKNSWGLNSLMKSAKKKLNSLYTSVSDMFQKRSQRSLGEEVDTEPSLGDVLDNILNDVISEFVKEQGIKELKER